MRILIYMAITIGMMTAAFVLPQSLLERLRLEAFVDYLKRNIPGQQETIALAGVVGTVDPDDINWYRWLERNRPADLQNYYIRIDADSRALDGPETGWEKPHLVIRCRYDQTAVYVVWGYEVGSEKRIPAISYSLDQSPRREADWKLSENFQATGLWRDQGIVFIKALQQTKALSVAITTEDFAEPRLVSFDVEGLTEKIKPLRRTCAW